MIDCSTLLREYSDYKDGLMEPSRAAAVEAHLRACSLCGRYHAVLDKGIREFRTLPELRPSTDFIDRLQYRLCEREDRVRSWSGRESSGASVGFVLLVVLLIGAASWIPVLHLDRKTVELPPMLAVAPTPPPVHALFRSGPLLTPPVRASYVPPTSSPLFYHYTAVGSYAVYRPAQLLGPR